MSSVPAIAAADLPPGLRRLVGQLDAPEPAAGGVTPTGDVTAAGSVTPTGSVTAGSGATRADRGGASQRAAVLVLLTDAADPEVLLTVRSADLPHHAGQVSFPGGAMEPGETATAAALRETAEEVGLPAAAIHVIGRLPATRITVSRFAVQIVLAWWDGAAPLMASAAEVAAILSVPISRLVDPATRFTWLHPRGTTGPGFDLGDCCVAQSEARTAGSVRDTPLLDGIVVWGFTAGVLDTVLSCGGWARPWNVSDVRPVPGRFLPTTEWPRRDR